MALTYLSVALALGYELSPLSENLDFGAVTIDLFYTLSALVWLAVCITLVVRYRRRQLARPWLFALAMILVPPIYFGAVLLLTYMDF